MFFVEPSWELSEDIDIIRALTRRPELRRYQSFELGLNTPLYHVNAIVGMHFKDGNTLRRFKFNKLVDAVEMVQKSHFKYVEILQEPEFIFGRKNTFREIFSVWIGPDYPLHHDILIETNDGNFKVDLKSVCAPEDFSNSGYKKVWSRT